MTRLKPYVLPIALILGLLLHTICATLAPVVPVLIFAILVLAFSAVDLRHLRHTPLYLMLLTFQVGVGMAVYLCVNMLTHNIIVAEGMFITILCPVASSVAVISCMLGADRLTVTTYTIVGNLMVALAAPFLFTLIGAHPHLGFWASVWLILRRIGPTLALPFIVVLGLQQWLPRANASLARHNGWGFYLWALALLITLGQTIDYLIQHGGGMGGTILWLAAGAMAVCIMQFAVGRRIGHRYGDHIGGGQLLGQKNTAMGIWMANTFLHPLSAIALAFYSIYQNIFNSYQLWRQGRCANHKENHV